MSIEQCPYVTLETPPGSGGHWRCKLPASHVEAGEPHEPSLLMDEVRDQAFPAAPHWLPGIAAVRAAKDTRRWIQPSTCKGSYSLGSACGSCTRCDAEEKLLRTQGRWPYVPPHQPETSGYVQHHETSRKLVSPVLGLPWELTPCNSEQVERIAIRTHHDPPRLFLLNEVRSGSLTAPLQNAAYEDERRLVQCIVGAVNSQYLGGV